VFRRFLQRRAPLALAFSLVFAAAPAQADVWLEEIVPQDKALLYFETQDIGALKERFHTTDLGQLCQVLAPFTDELMGGFEGPMSEFDAELQENVGISLEQAFSVLRGGMAISVINLAEPGAEPQPAFVAAFNGPSAETVKKVLESVKEQGGDDVPPFEVLSLEGMVAIVAMADPAVLLERGAEGSLNDNPSFTSLRNKAWGGEEGVYYLFGHLQNALALAPPDPEVQNALGNLGLTNLTAFGMGLGFAGENMHEALTIATEGERTGVLAMIAGQAALQPRKLANQVPHNVLGFSACSFDMNKAFQDGLTIAEALEPGAKKEVEEGLMEMEAELGFSLSEFLGSLGSTWTFESSAPEGGISLLADTIISVDVKNATKLTQILGDLANLGGLEVKSIEKDGRTVFYLRAPLGQLGDDPTRHMNEEAAAIAISVTSLFGAWTIHDGRIYFSSMPQPIFSRFRALKKAALTESETFKRTAGAYWEGKTTGFSYSRMDKAASPIFHAGRFGLRMFEPFIRGAGVAVDTALLPAVAEIGEIVRPMVSQIAITDSAITIRLQGGPPLMTTAVTAGVFGGLAFTGMRESRGRARAMSVDMTLRQVHTAQMMFQADNGKYAESMDDLIGSGYIDVETVYGVPGYEILITEATADGFKLRAEPYEPGMPVITGDQDGIHGSDEEAPMEEDR
jgi:hypothetical protein